MLCASGQLGYIHEPFNVGFGATWLHPRPPYWFFYVCDENEEAMVRAMGRVLALRYPLRARWLEHPRVRGLGGVRHQAGLSIRYRMARLTPLLKDPIALFSTPWLARRFGVRPVLMVRHPAAFVASLKHLDWGFRFKHLHAQPLLIRDVLDPFGDQIEEYTRTTKPSIDQAILAWRLCSWAIGRFAEEHPDWAVVRHEDLARAPDLGFRRLYEHLGLEYNATARQAVAEHSSSSNPHDLPAEQPHEIRRDSRRVVGLWRARLTPAEIEHVREQTADVACRFYDPETWEGESGSGA
jgi:hypothetical protein